MKSFCGICAVFLVAVTVAAAQLDEVTKKLGLSVLACQKENGVSHADMQGVASRTASSKTMKCFLACLMNKQGVIDPANKLITDKLEKMIPNSVKSKDGKTLKSMAKDIGEQCKSISDADRCEAASKIFDCFASEAMKRGFTNLF